MEQQATQQRADGSPDIEAFISLLIEKGGTLADVKGFTREETEALYAIGYNFYNQQKHSEAEKVFAFLCLYNHLDVRFWTGLGAVREALQQYKLAIDAYSYASMLQHDNPLFPLQAAQCYLALKDYAQAENGVSAALHWSEGKAQHKAFELKARQLLKLINVKRRSPK